MRFIYLIPIILIGIIIPAYAQPFDFVEHGPNYDRTILERYENGTALVEWSSTPQRISDGDNWINYRFTETDNKYVFEGAHGNVNLNKQTCTISFNDEGTSIINSISTTLKEADYGNDIWSLDNINNQGCSFSKTITDNGVQVIATKSPGFLQSLFATVYDIDYSGKVKITYKYTNNDLTKLNSKFGFTQSFDGSFIVRIDGQTYDTNTIHDTVLFTKEQLEGKKIEIIKDQFSIAYDPQNYIHHYLWAFKIQNRHLVFDFTNAKESLGIGQTLEIDPRFGPTSGTIVGSYRSAVSNCGTYGAQDAGFTVGSDNIYCYYTSVEWNTASIPDTAIISDSDITYDTVTGVGSPSCDAVSVSGQPSVTSDSSDFSNIKAGSVYQAITCTGNNNDLSLDMGSSFDTTLQNRLTSDWMAFGMRKNPDSLSNNYGGINDIKLTVTYVTGSPNPPSGLSCTGAGRTSSCTWTASISATDITTYYLGKSINNSTFPHQFGNITSTGNVTSFIDGTYYRPGTLYYMNLTAGNGPYNSTTSAHSSFTSDTYPDAPTLTLIPLSETAMNATTVAGASSGGDTVQYFKLRCEKNNAGGWIDVTTNSTLPSNRKYTISGITLTSGDSLTCQWADANKVGFSSWSSNATSFVGTVITLTIPNGVIGDVIQVNGSATLVSGSSLPVNITQSRFYVDGVLTQTDSESISLNSIGDSDDSIGPFWYQFPSSASHIFTVKLTATNSSGTLTINPTANVTESREYNPAYQEAFTTPATLGIVNYTVSRYDGENGVLLHVNRDNVAVGETWPISCILQTNDEAANTKNQSLTWQGTWINRTDVGYFNGTWTGVRNTHGYITCVNPPNILFTTTSYTNSSLALFGIQIFDNSYGAMLGVPVGIFFLAMAGSMANKRTAPTWIIVVLGFAGTMAAIGFFTLDPLIWGLALVTGMLGVLVNQKVF